MAKTGNLTIEILKQIRDEMVATRVELRQEIALVRTDLGGRIDETNHRLDETNQRIGAVESALLDLAQQHRFLVRGFRTLTERDGAFDDRLDDLTGRVEAIEKRLG